MVWYMTGGSLTQRKKAAVALTAAFLILFSFLFFLCGMKIFSERSALMLIEKAEYEQSKSKEERCCRAWRKPERKRSQNRRYPIRYRDQTSVPARKLKRPGQ